MQGMVERCGGENAPGAVSTIHMKKAGMLMDYSRSFCRMRSKKKPQCTIAVKINEGMLDPLTLLPIIRGGLVTFTCIIAS